MDGPGGKGDEELVVFVGSLRGRGDGGKKLSVLASTLCCKVKFRGVKEWTNGQHQNAERQVAWNEEFYLGVRRDHVREDESFRVSLHREKKVLGGKVRGKLREKTTVPLTNVNIRVSMENILAWYPLEIGNDTALEDGMFEPAQLEIRIGCFWCSKEMLPTVQSPHAKKGKRARLFDRVVHSKKLQWTSRRRSVDAGEICLGKDREVITSADYWNASSRLKVTVLEARDLIAADSNGFSDPYCHVICRGVRQKTAKKKRTLNPQWNETFTFSPAEKIDSNDEILFFLRDHDFAQHDDDLGQVAVPMWTLRETSGQEVWYNVQPTQSMKRSSSSYYGRLRVVIEFHPAAGDAGWHHADTMLVPRNMQEEGPLRAESKEESLSSTETASPSSEEASAQNTGETVIGSDRPRLNVWIVQARNLPSADLNGYSDPFCKVKCCSVVKRTRIIRRTLNPRWECSLSFGEKDYITSSDVLEVEVFDKDFGGDVMNDLLGTVDIPLWTIVQKQKSPPTWYQLKSSKFAVAGEVQLRIEYIKSAMAREREKQLKRLYKGKVWLYELQVTVCSARNLSVADKKNRFANPYCVVECEGKEFKTSVNKKTLNPVWNQKFKFRSAKARSRIGLVRDDKLICTVFNRGSQDIGLGRVKIDLAYIVDKLGYIDLQGGEFLQDFPMEKASMLSAETKNGSPSRENFGRPPVASEILKSAKSTTMNLMKTSEEMTKKISDDSKTSVRAFVNATKRRATTTMKAMTLSDARDMSNLNYDLFGVDEESTTEQEEKLQNYGDLRLRLKLVPIAETRKMRVSKIHLHIRKVRGFVTANATTRSIQLPRLVYVRVTVGHFDKQTEDVILLEHNGGVANVGGHLYFDQDVDRIFDRVAAESSTEGSSDEVARFTVCDGETDRELCHGEVELEQLLDVMSAPSKFLWLQTKGAFQPQLNFSAERVFVEEELKPTIGYFDVQLIHSKLFIGGFNHTIRTVTRYNDEIHGVHTCFGTLNPQYNGLSFYIPATDMHRPVTIEVWTQKNGQDTDKRISAGKWGRLLATASMSPYELLELEAQIIFQEKRIVQDVTIPPIKLALVDPNKSAKINGTLWLRAEFVENVSASGVFAPNPNPYIRPGPPFSFANLFHEMNRTLVIFRKFLGFTRMLSFIMEWESPPVTLGFINVVVFFCLFDFLGSRFLLLPVVALCSYIVIRHKDRVEGKFIENLLNADDEADVTARLKVSVLRARYLVPKYITARQAEQSIDEYTMLNKMSRSVHARIHYRCNKHKAQGMIGWTCTRKDTLNPDFCGSLQDYSVREGNRTKGIHAKPRLLQWDHGVEHADSTSEASKGTGGVPCFEVLIDNVLMSWPLLLVSIKRGKDLLPADAGNTSDPYAVVKILREGKSSESKRTKVKFKTLNPVWEETMLFGRNAPITEEDVVEIKLWDSDVGKDEVLGKLELPLADFDRLVKQNVNRKTAETHSIHGVDFLTLWLPVNDEMGLPSDKHGKLYIALAWLDYAKCSVVERLERQRLLAATNVEREEEQKVEELIDSISPDSWIRSASEVVVEVMGEGKGKHEFLGECSVPVSMLVSDESNREQPIFERWMPLAPRFDGGKADADLRTQQERHMSCEGGGELCPFGEVLIRAELILPDAEAKQLLIDKEEAKRADRGTLIHKMRMLQNRLESFQSVLYDMNNTMEQFQNLFNWSHPRRTKNVLIFLVCLGLIFALIKSKYILLTITLFMVTEHFRPLGTMSLRFKHMLALLPTNDDITAVCAGSLVTAKRAQEGNSSGNDITNVAQLNAKQQASSSPSPETKRKRLSVPYLKKRKISLSHSSSRAVNGDEVFRGHMHVLQSVGGPIIGSRSRKWIRRYFVAQALNQLIELRVWADKEAFVEDLNPLSTFYIRSVEDVVSTTDIAQYLPTNFDELCFKVNHAKSTQKVEDGKSKAVYLACSTKEKREQWLAALKK